MFALPGANRSFRMTLRAWFRRYLIGDIVWPAGSVDRELRLDGVSHAWQDCVYGSVVIPGFGWIYEPGPARICIVPHPYGGWLQMLDCDVVDGGTNRPIANFCAGIGGAIGDDIHGPSRTDNTSWGKIKSMFR